LAFIWRIIACSPSLSIPSGSPIICHVTASPPTRVRVRVPGLVLCYVRLGGVTLIWSVVKLCYVRLGRGYLDLVSRQVMLC
jgi:hypothetical protein